MSGHSERASELQAAGDQLDRELLNAIRAASADGMAQEQIAATVGLSRARVSQLLRQT